MKPIQTEWDDEEEEFLPILPDDTAEAMKIVDEIVPPPEIKN